MNQNQSDRSTRDSDELESEDYRYIRPVRLWRGPMWLTRLKLWLIEKVYDDA